MTPSNLTIQSSVREFQKYFNQAFNLSAAATDQLYASTQTIAGGLIICRNFTVNSGVVLTISNPTTIICQTFVNNGTITMSPVAEEVLGKFRTTDAPTIPYFDPIYFKYDVETLQVAQSLPGPCSGGPSYGNGGHSANNGIIAPTVERSNLINTPSTGWTYLSCPVWWPIAQFKNPVLSVGAGLQGGKNYYSTSLAYQKQGEQGTFAVTGGGATTVYSGIIQPVVAAVGGLPGSFLEVFSRVSILNSATGIINCVGGTGANGGAAGCSNGGGGGGGGTGLYCEGTLSQLGTINCPGGVSVSGTSGRGGGGGGGGGIFLTAPTIVNTGTNNVAGGVRVNAQSSSGTAGVVFVEPYLRLWMPGEDDVVQGTRYQSN